MRKAGKRLFQRLGALRDIQIMMEWIEKLSPSPAWNSTVERAPSPAMPPAKQILRLPQTNQGARSQRSRSPSSAQNPRRARKRTKARSPRRPRRIRPQTMAPVDATLPRAAAHIRLGSALFKHLALERWTEARELHNRALRNRSQARSTASASASSASATSWKTSCPRSTKPGATTSKKCRTCSAKSMISTCSGPRRSPATFSRSRFPPALARANSLRARQTHRGLSEKDDRSRFALAGLARRAAPRQADSSASHPPHEALGEWPRSRLCPFRARRQPGSPTLRRSSSLRVAAVRRRRLSPL